MAIVIEEDKQQTSFLSVVIYVGILVTVVVVVYYVFFKSPQTIEVAKPEVFQANEALSGIRLDTEQLVSSPQFQSLQAYVPKLNPVQAGRANPFVPAPGAGFTTSTTGF